MWYEHMDSAFHNSKPMLPEPLGGSGNQSLETNASLDWLLGQIWWFDMKLYT